MLPGHLHAVWTLPPGDSDFSTRWRLIKSRFAKALPKQERRGALRVACNERSVWQRRFWEHLIRDDADYARHVEYCWINPLKHGLVTRVRDWPHSSFHRDVREGPVMLDWGRRGRDEWRIWRAAVIATPSMAVARRANHFILSKVTFVASQAPLCKIFDLRFPEVYDLLRPSRLGWRGGRVVTDVEAGSDGRFGCA